MAALRIILLERYPPLCEPSPEPEPQRNIEVHVGDSTGEGISPHPCYGAWVESAIGVQVAGW